MYPLSIRVLNYVTPLVAPPNDLRDRLVRSLPVQPGKIDDYTTALNICLRISYLKNIVQQGYVYLLIV